MKDSNKKNKKQQQQKQIRNRVGARVLSRQPLVTCRQAKAGAHAAPSAGTFGRTAATLGLLLRASFARLAIYVVNLQQLKGHKIE